MTLADDKVTIDDNISRRNLSEDKADGNDKTPR